MQILDLFFSRSIYKCVAYCEQVSLNELYYFYLVDYKSGCIKVMHYVLVNKNNRLKYTTATSGSSYVNEPVIFFTKAQILYYMYVHSAHSYEES